MSNQDITDFNQNITDLWSYYNNNGKRKNNDDNNNDPKRPKSDSDDEKLTQMSWLLNACFNDQPGFKPEYLYEPIFFKNDSYLKDGMMFCSRNDFMFELHLLSESDELMCDQNYRNVDLIFSERLNYLLNLIRSRLSKDFFSICMEILCHDNYLSKWNCNYIQYTNDLIVNIEAKVLCECGRNIPQMQDRNGLKYEIVNEVYEILPRDIALIVYSYYERESYKQIITELIFKNCFPNSNKNSNLTICNIIYEYSKPFIGADIKIGAVVESML